MASTASPVPLARLVLEDLRALPRERFALAGAALLALVLTALAIVIGTSPMGLWSFGLLCFGVGPVLLGAFAAARMASLRATRFSQSLYTLPVRSGRVLAAHVLVACTVAAAYLALSTLFLGVAGLHVGVPAEVWRLVGGGALLLAFAVALGTAAGVLMPGRSVAAPVGLTIGFLVLSMLAIPPAAALQGAEEETFLLRALHLSPHLLASDGLGILERSLGMEARSPALGLALVVAETAALLGLAAWAYTREQGPEGWESPPARRAILAALVVAVLAAPAVAADATYAPVEGHEPHGRGWSSWARNATFLVVPPGLPAKEAPWGDHLAGTGVAPLRADEPNARDVLLLLPAPEGKALLDVRVRLEGDARLRVEPGLVHLERVDAPERREPPPGGASRAMGGAVLRVPATLSPLDPEDLRSNWRQLWVNVTYRVEGEEAPREGHALGALRADVPDAVLHLALAGSPAVLLTTFAAVARRVRVG